MASNNLVKGLKRSALTLALSMCFAGAALAAETGGLRVSITGANGQPVAGATVKVSSPDSLSSRTATTGADGSAFLTGLDPAVNYTVEVVASGYNNFSAGNVAVVSNQNRSLGYRLAGAATADATTLDTVVVTGASLAAVDTTSATVSTVLNLDVVDSLPTGRNYQSYLQLVPGVKPSSNGNPSSKSGVNYSARGGTSGVSSDNTYLLDGVNVTNHMDGYAGAGFNSEIIQEQQVLTGGVAAEFEGGSGLVSKVITKSGSNEFHGSINYYLQNDNLVAKDKHNTSQGFSTYDTAVTLGGPIMKDRLWFFGSYQIKEREDEVVDPNTNTLMRTPKSESRYAFLKATWQITDDDRLTASYFSDPGESSGSTSSSTPNNRDLASEYGGDNYKLDYIHYWDNLSLNIYGARHEAEYSQLPANTETRNSLAYKGGNPTPSDLNRGGNGSVFESQNNRDEFGISAEYLLDTNFGSHTFKVGYTQVENDYIETSQVLGGAFYESIPTQNAGVTLQQYVGAGWNGTRRFISSTDALRLVGGINGSNNLLSTADRAYALGLLDSDHSGAVNLAELMAYQLTSTAGNPGGQVNVSRYYQPDLTTIAHGNKGQSFYLQDTWTLNQWTVNAGVRAEQWKHYDTEGNNFFTFDWEFAPRLSVVYDLAGDGRSKVWAFYGRYYDPVRTNMTDFAGDLTAVPKYEQLFIGDRWLTYRDRSVSGGSYDGYFAPSIKTPYTDEIMLGFATTFGSNLSLQTIFTHRVTENLLEDYDLGYYADPTCVNSEDHYYCAGGTPYYLPLSYFGFETAPNSNYVIATLAGGKRKYDGLEVTLQKQKSDNWQGMLSYTRNIAKSNSTSDSNADLQGDLLWLDPRGPNQYGPALGNIDHQVKAFGTYFFDFGLEFSGVFNWNSGVVYGKMERPYGISQPILGDIRNIGGVWSPWPVAGSVGRETAPAYYTLDVRAKYTKEFPVGQLELFLDVFNILDKQSVTREEELFYGGSLYDFGEANQWVQPRRAYLGVRYSF